MCVCVCACVFCSYLVVTGAMQPNAFVVHVIDQFTYLLDVVFVYNSLVLNDFGGDFVVV